MKTVSDPRHLKRKKTVQELFALSFNPKIRGGALTQKIKLQLSEIDNLINQAAPVFPLDKIGKVDLAILRLAVFELENKTAPPKVVIDEAVELAKEFGGETSFSFINGVLGTIFKNLPKGRYELSKT